ncbi:unnamed protein product [Malus baccata var. baccata]
MLDYYEQLASRPSYHDSLKVLEADIQYANMLAASIPRSKGGTVLQMKLVYSDLAHIFLFLLQWIDCSSSCLFSSYLNLFHIIVYKVGFCLACSYVSNVRSDGRSNISSCGRKATISEFYSIVVSAIHHYSCLSQHKTADVILPSLQCLHGDSLEMDTTQEEALEIAARKPYEDKIKLSDVDLEREDECGICLVTCTKMVLPNCCHAMCVNCYRDWNIRSESCPFCRGSLKRVNSGDLWVLTCCSDVVDTQTVLKEDMLRFYLFINRLPKDLPDALFLIEMNSIPIYVLRRAFTGGGRRRAASGKHVEVVGVITLPTAGLEALRETVLARILHDCEMGIPVVWLLTLLTHPTLSLSSSGANVIANGKQPESGRPWTTTYLAPFFNTSNPTDPKLLNCITWHSRSKCISIIIDSDFSNPKKCIIKFAFRSSNFATFTFQELVEPKQLRQDRLRSDGKAEVVLHKELVLYGSGTRDGEVNSVS